MPPAPQHQRQQAVRYFLAIVVTAAAVVVAQLVRQLVSPTVAPPFILAVAIAALYGGKDQVPSPRS